MKVNISFDEATKDIKEVKKLYDDVDWWNNRESYIQIVIKLKHLMKKNIHSSIISNSAKIENNVTIQGNVIVCQNVLIRSGSYIIGPVIIGDETRIGPNCFLNGNSIIGKNNSIGHGAEVKNSIYFDFVKQYHFSYIGNSILGKGVNVAAGVVTAVRRFDNRNILIEFDNNKFYDTYQKKFGALVGDNAQIGIGVMIYPGRSIGPHKWVEPGNIIKHNIS